MKQENKIEMKEFASADLLDKANPLVGKVFEAGFEYLLAGVCKAHAKWKRLEFQEFNDKNELQRSLLLTYPFFISLANGHGNSLYNLFGNFLSYTYGPASMPIRDLLPRSKESINLNFFTIKPTKVMIKGSYQGFDHLQNTIMTKIFEEDESIRLANIAVQKDNSEDIFTPLCELISKGIEIVRDRVGDNFFDGNPKRVLDLASQFDAWKKPYQESKIQAIEYRDIIKQPAPKRPFFSLEYA